MRCAHECLVVWNYLKRALLFWLLRQELNKSSWSGRRGSALEKVVQFPCKREMYGCNRGRLSKLLDVRAPLRCVQVLTQIGVKK